jgi:hypothetical protein
MSSYLEALKVTPIGTILALVTCGVFLDLIAFQWWLFGSRSISDRDIFQAFIDLLG